jgi:hypothetical protein
MNLYKSLWFSEAFENLKLITFAVKEDVENEKVGANA